MLTVSELSKHFDGVVALSGFKLSLAPGETLGLMGPNGAGKTTLLDVICGLTRADSGEVLLGTQRLTGCAPHVVLRAGVARCFQELRVVPTLRAIEHVALGGQGQVGESVVTGLLRGRASRRDQARRRSAAMELLVQTGLEACAEAPVGGLSFGQQKMIALLTCVTSGAKVLLLDEPAAGLSPAALELMLDFLARQARDDRAILLVEHNMEVIARLCSRVIVMDAGVKVAEGDFRVVRRDPRVLASYLRVPARVEARPDGPTPPSN